MTETQAKSGAAGASTTPVEEEAADGGTPSTGRTAVGRAAVPADGSSPKFTRAPGMMPPPDQPRNDKGGGEPERSARGSAAPRTAIGGAMGGTARGTSTKAAPGARPDTSGTRPGATGTGRVLPGTPSRNPAAVGAARVTDAVRAARGTIGAAASRGPRRARLNVKRIDPWSVMKFSFAVSLVLFIVAIVATSVLYLALDAMGVFKTVNNSLADLINAGGGQDAGGFKITASGVIGTSAVIGAVNVVLFTALATLGAFIYNVCADLVGGIELTLAERE
jgi:hypothetical protein